MSMSKKDYELIAGVIAKQPSSRFRIELVTELCKALVADNAMFNADEFIAACLGLKYTPHPIHYAVATGSLDPKDIDAVMAEREFQDACQEQARFLLWEKEQEELEELEAIYAGEQAEKGSCGYERI